MARIEPLLLSALPPSVKVTFERHLRECPEEITNTKATLGHPLLAFEVYMQWYQLYRSVEEILALRLACLYEHALSLASCCPLYVAYFRKKLTDAGEGLSELCFREDERRIVDFGCTVAKHHGKIADHIYNNISKQFSNSEIVTLIAFAGQMIAMSVFTNVAETEPDTYLEQYLPEEFLF